METWEVGTRFGLTKDRIMAVSDTNLAFLSDFITVPTWFPYKVAFSIGDIFISVGAFLLLWSLSSTEKEKK
jgi:lipoprotein signal peptidase